ncbi:tryptophan--tRNA ligase, mitochondrial [Lingula anatina]|uniref:Tryptophan--tRNA ligase, mitochondrial n=1 Tax=Lingula anatina TaxID=7574 RepID=A0A1S3HEY5_LINAN|nr:tryptophan--tRNA ligase, mitochondrial [Lingula anatina]|eukprot:XP_013383599.1 tryptophan--tRNA ligase, mitochondrial [Lingula anatina]
MKIAHPILQVQSYLRISIKPISNHLSNQETYQGFSWANMALPSTRRGFRTAMRLSKQCSLTHLSTAKRTYAETKIKKKPKGIFAKCPPTVFSGIQPTGIPHIGNYLGAIKNWVHMQNTHQRVLFCIVDLHSVTLPQNPNALRQSIFDTAACLLACGIDPDKAILFQQSDVPQHSELCWAFTCLTTLPRIQSLPQWKEKSEKYAKDINVGLMTYPILQAADILLYKGTEVPVGEDQIPHVELAQDLARIFNYRFGEFFPKASAVIPKSARIKSLRTPTSKMSKSEIDVKSRIDLTDSPEVIRGKIKKAVTDFTPEIFYDPDNRPGISNLMDIHAAFTGLSSDEITEQNKLKNTVGYKSEVADIVTQYLTPIREKVLRLREQPEYVQQILDRGAERAGDIAQENWMQIRKLMGFK